MNSLKKITQIKNYSGGIKITQIHGKIKPLKKNYHHVLNIDLTGDAPKDFIRLYEYGVSKKSDVKNWAKYIAKVGHKWYPLESVSEYLLNQIGEILGLEMAYSQLRLADNQIRFLSKFFLVEGEELIHGAEIFSAYLEESDTAFIDEIEAMQLSRSLLTFQFAKDAIQKVFPEEATIIINNFVGMLIFDAIVGNNDRHFYNWGIVHQIMNDTKTPYFSPIYDTARGLFWNVSEAVLNKKFYYENGKINQQALDKYMKLSRPKIGWDGKEDINHFDLIEHLFYEDEDYQKICNQLLNNVNLLEIQHLIKSEFKHFYTKERCNLVCECISQRFNKLQKRCKED